MGSRIRKRAIQVYVGQTIDGMLRGGRHLRTGVALPMHGRLGLSIVNRQSADKADNF